MNTKHLFALIIGILALTACGSDTDDDGGGAGDATITISQSEITAPATGGAYTVNVSSSRNEWTAFTDQTAWVTLSNSGTASQSGTTTITIAANTGDERTANVTFRAGTARSTLKITQKAAMQVSAKTVYSNSRGESQNITISGATEWTATASEIWLTAHKTDNTTLTVTTQANDATKSRTATVTVTADNGTVDITVIQESAEDREMTIPAGYRLVWHDEFNEGTTLGSDWTHEVQSAGWVNNELQNYVNGAAEGKRVTELVDGKLCINCFLSPSGIKESSGPNAGNTKVYSGRVYAKVGTGWKYGYFEARIMLPKGKGTWPAWWMMPVNNNFSTNPWPGCGEIDIMEEVGVDAGDVSATIHCNKYNNGNTSIEHGGTHFADAESEYHVYACEWTPDFIRFIFDGKQVLNYRNDGSGKDAWPFDVAFYPILNLAWGGAWGGYRGVDESALPVTMKVDYVRVFQKQ